MPFSLCRITARPLGKLATSAGSPAPRLTTPPSGSSAARCATPKPAIPTDAPSPMSATAAAGDATSLSIT